MLLAGSASIVFAIGTALQAFVIVNQDTLTRMMILADADPVGAEGFLTAFRLVGCVCLIGNAIGILALRRRPSPWLFWLMLAVNATQAVGLKAVPAEMFTAARDEFGWPGMLPSLITDGGAAILAIILLATYAVTHTTWGQVRR
ncbi:hypothetical protein F3087_08165 [Nocardia colli]|uniref:Uncharacterized protein n=1 Tax=Nocardia colli TaxID=2545717 RepID=A0A5N0EJP1_9NOCA|nr:hypothetical protein F3087_08165 [Nocardia colli]